MNVRSVFQRKRSPRLAAAALVACLLSPGVAAAQNPIADKIDGTAPRKIDGPAADRMVAEWMLRMGGSIVLEGQRKPITDLADLPTADFRIHTLNFTGITMYAASLQDELRRLPALPHLKELYVNGRLWYDQPAPRVQATIALFNEATSLEKFVMSKPVQTYIPFNDPALKGLSSLKNLKEVRIHQTRSSGMSLAAFPLTHLDLNYAVTFNDAGMASLKGKTTLQRVYLRGTSITDAGIQHLSGLTNLVELDLSDVDMTDAGLAHLSGLTKLRRLNLQSANVTDAGIDVLKNMPELEELSLYRTKVSNAGLAKLSGLKNLRSVDLRYSRVTSSGVRELTSKLPKAEFLILESSNPEPKRAMAASVVAARGDAAVAEWLRAIGGKVQMTNGAITAVSLNGTSITDREFVVLTRLPQLKDLSLQHTEISTIGARAACGGPLARTARPRSHASRRQRASDARVADQPARARAAEHARRRHGSRRTEGAAEPARDRSRQRADCERGHGAAGAVDRPRVNQPAPHRHHRRRHGALRRIEEPQAARPDVGRHHGKRSRGSGAADRSSRISTSALRASPSLDSR